MIRRAGLKELKSIVEITRDRLDKMPGKAGEKPGCYPGYEKEKVLFCVLQDLLYPVFVDN